MIPEPLHDPVMVETAVAGWVQRDRGGAVLSSSPGVTVRVEYEPGDGAAASAALDKAVEAVKARIADTSDEG